MITRYCLIDVRRHCSILIFPISAIYAYPKVPQAMVSKRNGYPFRFRRIAGNGWRLRCAAVDLDGSDKTFAQVEEDVLYRTKLSHTVLSACLCKLVHHKVIKSIKIIGDLTTRFAIQGVGKFSDNRHGPTDALEFQGWPVFLNTEDCLTGKADRAIIQHDQNLLGRGVENLTILVLIHLISIGIHYFFPVIMLLIRSIC